MKKSLKSVLIGALVLVMVLSIGMVTVFADEVNTRGSRFVDADNDGICDNYAENEKRNFVDTDGDGVCDNAAENCNGLECGHGTGNGRKSGNGNGLGDGTGKANGGGGRHAFGKGKHV